MKRYVYTDNGRVVFDTTADTWEEAQDKYYELTNIKTSRDKWTAYSLSNRANTDWYRRNVRSL